MRTSFLPFALPDIGDTDIDLVKEVLASGWITTGPKAREFEQLFAQAVGARHAIAVNSCTAALHLALEAVGLQPGDEVIVPTYTFAATAEVVRYFDARPVMVDICTEDFNLNVANVEQSITPRTRAIIPVHIAGVPADLDALYAVAARHDLAIVEDAAHAFPCLYKGRKIGQPVTGPARPIRHVACFSFYATKTITTGEGGMICTDNDEIAERCRIMALHGISKDAWKRYTAEGTWYYEIVAPGYKYNMTDVAAALGLTQLAKAETMWRRRQAIAHAFNSVFAELPELQIPTDSGLRRQPNGHDHSAALGYDYQHAWHLYMLRIIPARLTIDRNQFFDEIKRRNVGVSVHFIPLHIHPYYRDTYGYRPEDFPVAYQEFQREISLPIYSRMTDQDVQDVIDVVTEIVNQHRC